MEDDHKVGEEKIEQDSIETEEISNIWDYLTKMSPQCSNTTKFGLHYDKSVFQGWVKQPSACCGAAAVAGAWNSLCNLHRNDERAINHEDVLKIYREMFLTSIDKKKLSFERKLGSSVDSLIDDIQQKLFLVGKEIGGKKKDGTHVTKIAVKNIIKDLIKSNNNSNTKSMNTSDEIIIENNRSAIDCIQELIEINKKSNSDSEEQSEDDDSDIDNEEEIKTTNKKVYNKETTQWDWLKDFMDLLKAMGGLNKLNAIRPSTAPIGNGSIIEAIEMMSTNRLGGSSEIKGRLFMGKRKSTKTKIDNFISKKDSEEEITNQWNSLRSAFCTNNQVLLFHLKNHYALIFAIREYVEDNNNKRQLLTARKGQRPIAWIEFEEARETMLSWEGYKILAISCANTVKNNYK